MAISKRRSASEDVAKAAGFAVAKLAGAKTPAPSGKEAAFDTRAFLNSAGLARRLVELGPAEVVYSQGDAASHVLYIQRGSVQLSVISETGKEAVVGILGPGDFFGEGCLAGQSVRMGRAIAIARTTALVIDKDEMRRVLHEEHAFSDFFISYVLGRNIRIEEDLVDQLFNSSEKRLARTLLLLARYGKQSQPHQDLPRISQQTLAEMIGTTRSRVNFFMNKFRKLGFIDYNGRLGLRVNNSLLTIVLHD